MGLFGPSTEPFLPDRDYLPVAMPTTDVHVLQVLTRDGRALRRYSDLERIVLGPAAPPVVARDQAVVDASGKATSRAKLDVGLNVVSSLIRALGGDAGLDVTVERAATVEYGYSGVVADRVDLASLDQWLAAGALAPDLRNAADLIGARDVYVVVGALKARAVEVRLLDEASNGVEVDVPAIQAAVGGKVSVSGGSTRSSRMTFQGENPLTVAAKAAQLRLGAGGLWINERFRTDGEVRTIDEPYQFLGGAELELD
ncbi:hypothetical protein [Dactylosporangium sp. CA-139066]|uniref:gasdermin n=1 Tax=Dactylosporangium sp. CA-139066 TaxID=3239930 RepID=UPI003D8ED406